MGGSDYDYYSCKIIATHRPCKCAISGLVLNSAYVYEDPTVLKNNPKVPSYWGVK